MIDALELDERGVGVGVGETGDDALDLIGERWALLIVRELLASPMRYTDLAAGLQTTNDACH